MIPNQSGIRLPWATGVIVAVALVGAGAGGAYWWVRSATPPAKATARAGAASPAQPSADTSAPRRAEPQSASPFPDVVVPLSAEAASRAGIAVTTVGASTANRGLRIPGVVQANAYRSVNVTPLVNGRVTRVNAELGQPVKRGQRLAEIYSPDLAEAETRYLSSRAELDAHEQVLRRTEQLVEIGSASRQELEKIHAEHTAATAMVQNNRSRLRLLGMNESDIDQLSPGADLQSTMYVVAPIDGVVTARQANVGLNVESASALFTVVDLSTVWIVGELYERDFGAVSVGSAATVTTTAYPDLTLEGKVSYIDPELKTDTRTAQLRVEVVNRNHALRFGMYADVLISDARSRAALVVPSSAIQVVGDRSVVYLVDARDGSRFIERDVHLGTAVNGNVEVLGGLKAGDSVVSAGSFSVRAERERLGLRAVGDRAAGASTTNPTSAIQTATVSVTEQGYEPNRVSLRSGVPARLTFVRTTDHTCGLEVTIPSLNIRRPLPLNHNVDIEFTPDKSGEIGFECGMKMLKGTIVVQ